MENGPQQATVFMGFSCNHTITYKQPIMTPRWTLNYRGEWQEKEISYRGEWQEKEISNPKTYRYVFWINRSPPHAAHFTNL